MVKAAVVTDVNVPDLTVAAENAGDGSVPLRRGGGDVGDVARPAGGAGSGDTFWDLGDVVAHGGQGGGGNKDVVNGGVGRGPYRRHEITMPGLARTRSSDGGDLRIVRPRRHDFETVPAIRLEAVADDAAIGLTGDGGGVFGIPQAGHGHAGVGLGGRVDDIVLGVGLN